MSATEAQIEMHSFHSDVYKEVHNIRPRWLRPEDRTVEEWQAMIGRLLVEQNAHQEREEEEAAHQAWVTKVTACEPLRVPLAHFMPR